MTPRFGIYEPLYLPGQTITNGALLPLAVDNTVAPGWREFRILVDMYRDRVFRRHHGTGVLSPKFSLKSELALERFMDFAARHVDCDVCFVNPFPQLSYWSFNVWMQGEHAHPGLHDAAQALLDASGIAWDLNDVPRQGRDRLAYCNFWVGSERFWEAYVGQVLVPIAEFLENNPDHPASSTVMRETMHTDAAPMLPFIVERLFSTFLSLNAGWKVACVEFSYDDVLAHCVDDFERTMCNGMRSVVEEADATGVFDARLRGQMELMCALWQQHFLDVYSLVPHPHTGRVLTRGSAAR